MYGDTPVIIELNADSLSALDSLKWLVNRIAGWIDEEKHVEECSER
jgi:fatty acid-binding protein DegV